MCHAGRSPKALSNNLVYPNVSALPDPSIGHPPSVILRPRLCELNLSAARCSAKRGRSASCVHLQTGHFNNPSEHRECWSLVPAQVTSWLSASGTTIRYSALILECAGYTSAGDVSWTRAYQCLRSFAAAQNICLFPTTLSIL